MYSLVRALGFQIAAKQELIPFSVSFVLAELFFKFKSFSLECLAFLALWALLSLVQSRVIPSLYRASETSDR